MCWYTDKMQIDLLIAWLVIILIVIHNYLPPFVLFESNSERR